MQPKAWYHGMFLTLFGVAPFVACIRNTLMLRPGSSSSVSGAGFREQGNRDFDGVPTAAGITSAGRFGSVEL